MDGLLLRLDADRLSPRVRSARCNRPSAASASGCISGRGSPLTLRPAGRPASCSAAPTSAATSPPSYDACPTPGCAPCWLAGIRTARVGTVEHLMAALAGCGVDNVMVEVDGPEVPVLDGSPSPFVFLLDCAGVVEQAAPARSITVLRTVRVTDGEAFAELRPTGGPGLDMAVSIAFEAAAIGRQALSLRLDGRQLPPRVGGRPHLRHGARHRRVASGWPRPRRQPRQRRGR